MAKRVHVMTPARKAALRKAQLAAYRSKKRAKLARNRGRAPKAANRGIGLAGLKKNTIPYVRVNKRSQTTGFNAGTIIPGTHKRIVIGGYSRIENTNRANAFDAMMVGLTNKVTPKNSRRGKIFGFFKQNVKVSKPAVRASLGGAEARLSTSRGAGTTLVIRRGRHKISQVASSRAINRYDTHARKLHARRRKKPRAQRRNRR